jgi:hypothetical protein
MQAAKRAIKIFKLKKNNFSNFFTIYRNFGTPFAIYSNRKARTQKNQQQKKGLSSCLSLWHKH